MKYFSDEDIIVALSSPLGTGAIAVIRVGGEKAAELVNSLLLKPLDSDNARLAIFNEVRSAGTAKTIDQVVTTFFKAPASYTGDDIIEITCHCNPLIIDRIIQAVLQAGARIAQPGEFTYRAFLNGKLDLSQAEAVASLINSRSRQSLNQSLRHLEGKLSNHVNDIKTDILNYLSLIEISLDFSEEDIELLPYAQLTQRILATVAKLQALLKTYDYGRLLQEGIKLLIIGKPNVGKSSLLNALLQKERSIVSDIPGTTRDYIEASLEIDGIAVQAVDTAGIRNTTDAVEAAGVERTLQQLQTADIVLGVFEAHRPLDADDEELKTIIAAHASALKTVLVLNKSDLGNAQNLAHLAKLNLPAVEISAHTGTGLNHLKTAIKSQLMHDVGMESEEVVITSARHKQVIEKTVSALQQAIEAINLGVSEEMLAVDIRLAMDHLGEITGETTSEDVLNHIFSSFCIGK